MFRFTRGLLGSSRPIRRRSCRENFVDLRAAKEFIRPLGLRSVSEWSLWCKSGLRPQHIPADPSKTYRVSGWQGFPDFLGYERRREEDPEVEQARSEPRAQQLRHQNNKHRSSSSLGAAACSHFLRQFASPSCSIEFRPLSHGSLAQFAYRPRISGDKGLWAPLHVRGAKNTSSSIRNDIVSFNRPKIDIGGGMVCVFLDRGIDDVLSFMFVDHDSLNKLQDGLQPKTAKLYFRLSSSDVYTKVASQDELEQLLARQYEHSSASLVSEEDIAEKWFRGARLQLHTMLVRQLVHKLYFQSEKLTFSSAIPEGGKLYHGLVANKKIIHAAVKFHNHGTRGSPGLRVTLMKWFKDRVYLPLHVDDGFDFIVAMYRRPAGLKTLQGVSIIPKRLIGTALSTSDGQRGTCNLSLFPPDFPVHRPSSVKKKAGQLRFYIDLSQDTTSAEQIQKAEQIFAGEWEGHGDDDDPCF